METDSRPLLVLVDGSSYIFRAYHAIQHLSTSQGVPTNAVYGVTRMLLKLLDELHPSHIAVILDKGGKTFRHDLYPEYKAHRPPAPEDLVVQLPVVREAIAALNLPLIEQAGVEGDDLIGSLARRAVKDGFDVLISSGDKDLMQLVDDHIRMVDSLREAQYDRNAVCEKLGVPPERIADLLALMGDASDNIPGVTGVGEKTAAKLLAEYGDLEGVLAAAAGMKKSKLRDNLIKDAPMARLSLQLATLKLDLKLPISPTDLIRQPVDEERLNRFLEKCEFTSLRRTLAPKKTLDADRYQTIVGATELETVLARIRTTRTCAIDLETTSLEPVRAEIVGISLSPALGEAYYIPVAHRGETAAGQLPRAEVIERLRSVLTDPQVRWFGHNLKYDAIVLLNRHRLACATIACDSMLASYLLDPDRFSHSLDSLTQEFLGHDPLTYQQVTGKGKQQISFADVDVQTATRYSCEDADATFRLSELLLPRLAEAGLMQLFTEMELPLIPVLVVMELAGIRVDPEQLRLLGGELERELQRSQERIFKLAGHEFNIQSPQQLRKVLFEELQLTEKKKTKSGASTDSTVLEELAISHELPGEILNYRSLAKLKSTYVDVLPEMVNPETGCIHTSFNQAVAATGRLSSSDPNLQNIPARTELGLRIREAFVASPGCRLLSADYSQVELRILAHISQDAALLEAFQHGEDVHAHTAARVFGVPIAQVTSDMRQRAKAVNFGIIYGQGPFNLSRQLRIPRAEAKAIIDSYLEKHHGVRTWVEKIHEQARRQGYVSTLFGRKRFVPDINSPNHAARANAERIAQNTPLQGTAADIIKRAMIIIHRELKERGLRSRMVLQVHDELVFDVPESELETIQTLVREKMEGAAKPHLKLTVDIAIGRTWAEAR
jgi:DNA polymerase-1